MMIRGLAGRLSLVVCVAVSMTACSGGSSPSMPGKTVVATPTPAPGQSAGPAANATFTIVVPAAVKTQSSRSREYVSVATKSIELSSSALDPAGPVILNVANSGTGPGTGSGTNTSGSCTGSGPFTCTIKVHLSPGSDSVTLATFDTAGASGNVLSQQIVTVSVVEGVANSFPITLDANAASMTVTASVPCSNAPVTSSVGSVGGTPVSFTVAYTDPATKPVKTPGLPTLAVTSSGVSGGTITISGVTSDPPAFTLTPSASGVTGTIAVKATPANASDGLAFSLTKSFTFSSGFPEPASLLAVPEQGGTNPGQLNLYTINSTSQISAASPATLSDQNNDVDNPQAVAFDTAGNLLIANGGTDVSGDFGNVACVPAGSIVTASSQSTTVSTNVDDPDSIAFGSDGSIGIANAAGGATDALAEFKENGNYVDSGNDVAGNSAVSVAAFTGVTPTGTYAVSLPAKNQVIIRTAAGSSTILTDATNIVSPESLAWDPASDQLAVNNNPFDPTSTAAYVSFFTAAGTFVNHAALSDSSFGGPYTGAPNPGTLAASSDGKIAAVAYDCSSYEAVFVFGNTPARTLLGIIPFNTTTVADGGTDLIYGGNANVRSLTWLSTTKLLVALESTGSNTANADPHEGLYIFDVSQSATPSGFNDCDETAAPSGPKQIAFLHTTLPPLATAYKP